MLFKSAYSVHYGSFHTWKHFILFSRNEKCSLLEAYYKTMIQASMDKFVKPTRKREVASFSLLLLHFLVFD